MNRRSFLIGSSVLLAAPSIVRASNLMPVSVPKPMTAIEVWQLQACQREALQAILDMIVNPPMVVWDDGSVYPWLGASLWKWTLQQSARAVIPRLPLRSGA